MTHKEYNGYFNFETWNLNLWMSNDEGSDSYFREVAEGCIRHARAGSCFTQKEQATLDLSDALKEHFEQGKDDLLESAKASCSVWADLLTAALSEVNWHEIAGHMIDEAWEAISEAVAESAEADA